MNSTWTDNDQIIDTTQRKYDSGLKKVNGNRIQVVSKINPGGERNIVQFRYNNSNDNAQILNQTCLQKSDRLAVRRANTTTEDHFDRNERDKNILKLMQEQLQLAKNSYQQKIKNQLKESSMFSQLSKLKIKIQNNNELIAAKDHQIQQLKIQLSRSSPTRSSQLQKFTPNSSIILQKINEIQAKFAAMGENHNKLTSKINDIGTKVQFVEKGLLSLFACRLFHIQNKMNEYVQNSNKRLSNIEINSLSKLKKQVTNSTTNLKSMQLPSNVQISLQRLQSLRQEVLMFKNKQFRYENSNIGTLRKDINELKIVVGQIQKKIQAIRNNKLRNSKASRASSRKNHDSSKRNNSINLSNYFEDYQQVCEELDSLGQDQFFHPLQQSTKKFASKQHTQYRTPHQSNQLHNDSFQNFTGDEEQQQSNQKRLTLVLKAGGYKLPLPIQIDLTGFLRKKSDQKYLFDHHKKGFMLSTMELNKCREKGLITW